MLESFSVSHYKSIVDLELELGRFNVFIGENGCGKSNLLEAFGMAAAAATDRLTNEDLIARGIRVARPSLTLSAFKDDPVPGGFEMSCRHSVAGATQTATTVQRFVWGGDRWTRPEEKEFTYEQFVEFIRERDNRVGVVAGDSLLQVLSNVSDEVRRITARAVLESNLRPHRHSLRELLSVFGIYTPSVLALRGLQTESHREPLGLYGERLDVTIARLSKSELAQLGEHAGLISWVEDLEIDEKGELKTQGFKLGRSRSELYFHDRFMADNNKTFSAENANEGILHVLFYLALFLSKDTPKVFAIDNIETSLNPVLLRHLIKSLVQLAKEHDKQALVTTHSPAALDGLDLNDDAQRLFVVYRSDEGHTKVKRIKKKPEQAEGRFKLSELWMRGMLGAIPQGF